MKKISFPVDVRRSKTPLLKLPIKDRLSECRPESAESSIVDRTSVSTTCMLVIFRFKMSSELPVDCIKLD